MTRTGPITSDDRRKRHKPLALNLGREKETNSDVALRIVSPGLPPLNKEMRSTVQISQKIEQQQKSLIAARHSGSNSNTSAEKSQTYSPDNEGNEKHDRDSDDNNASSNQVSDNDDNDENNSGDKKQESDLLQDNLTDDLDSGSAPLTPKRLKRDKIPTPLKISSFSNNNINHGYSPLIQSAPIRQQIHSAKPIFRNTQMAPKRFVQAMHQPMMTPQFQINPYIMPIQRMPYVVLPVAQNMSPVPSYNESYPHERFTSGQHNPPALSRNAGQHSVISSSDPEVLQSAKVKHISVTDVYHGDYTKDAPFKSQPLSAQKKYFDKSEKGIYEEDRTPVSEAEIKEMQEKYKGSAVNEDIANSIGTNKEDSIFGTITFMNENTFNFKIFNQKSTNFEPEENANDSDVQKKNFLKICERTWDEFVSSKDTN